MDPDPDPDWIWIRIRIRNRPKSLDPDPDPGQMNADPQPCYLAVLRIRDGYPGSRSQNSLDPGSATLLFSQFFCYLCKNILRI